VTSEAPADSTGAAATGLGLGLWRWSPEGGELRANPLPGEATPALAPQEIRYRLLGVAAELFRSKGFALATTRELAKLLGLKKASLYYYVNSKQDLLYEICMESLRSISDEVQKAVETAAPADRLTAAIRAHVESACRDLAMHTVTLIELRALLPEHLADVVELRSAYERRLRSLLEQEQQAGKLRQDVDCRYLTLMLLNLLNWTIFWYNPAGPLSAQDLAKLISMQFVEGAGAVGAGGTSPVESTKRQM
jgi:TetR/AcrR family transcriptional regulator, cholesterol catabolism regulator